MNKVEEIDAIKRVLEDHRRQLLEIAEQLVDLNKLRQERSEEDRAALRAIEREFGVRL